MPKQLRSQQGPLQASIDERSEELTELVGIVGESSCLEKLDFLNLWLKQDVGESTVRSVCYVRNGAKIYFSGIMLHTIIFVKNIAILLQSCCNIE